MDEPPQYCCGKRVVGVEKVVIFLDWGSKGDGGEQLGSVRLIGATGDAATSRSLLSRCASREAVMKCPNKWNSAGGERSQQVFYGRQRGNGIILWAVQG